MTVMAEDGSVNGERKKRASVPVQNFSIHYVPLVREDIHYCT